ncbi:pyridoxamine 5'-phosphate oxidase family protein [Tamaricihabitans halophyticus]|uniref:Pyridoxamine 5'-phosphate oxidase family protein n=1 Tax=Tamaricihabitans halophyticus TaxID=1262583 RepID=A0A4V2SVC2_9PSEU|nr:PPOX class F420-dependent oxidoreductase [Tamaricihabitans halophyticus]TCP57406.1 pyridoxamine 5'-phosphate oxidase family protein [Tamaricihabitans halophyticus]
MIFSEAERNYLKTQQLGRMATVSRDGAPEVKAIGFTFDPETGTIDTGGPGLSSTKRWRNLQHNPLVSFIVDDMTPDEPGEVAPGWGRGVEIRGRVELLDDHEPPMAPDFFSREVIRIHPTRVVSWHLDAARPEIAARDVR